MKFYAILAAVLALIGAGLYVNRLQHKAARVDVAEKALSDYTVAVKARETKAAADQLKAEKRSTTLASTLNTVAGELNELRSKPPKHMVKYVQLPGESCPQLRLDPEWVQQYNAASDASAVPYPN